MDANTAHRLVLAYEEEQKAKRLANLKRVYEAIEKQAKAGHRSLVYSRLNEEEKQELIRRNFEVEDETATDQRTGDYTQTVIRW